jgi:methylaspartate mutase epsilon subunit
MGVYPRTVAGARRLLAESARLAVRSRASRLIVKTTAEAHRLPSVAENVAALEYAAAAARGVTPRTAASDTGILAQAKALVDNAIALDDDIGRALVAAFALGQLDVPFCLHPDNAGRTRGYIAADGRLAWQRIGALPIGDLVELPAAERMTSADLLSALRYVEHRFDDRGEPETVLAGPRRTTVTSRAGE